MTATALAAFFGILLVLAVAPGPTDVALAARSVKFGASQGLIMVGGIVAADFALIIISVAGLAAASKTLGDFFVLADSPNKRPSEVR